MLRVMDGEAHNGIRVLRLEGRLVGPWVEEVRRAAEDAPEGPGALAIDLGCVSFLDADGVALLQRLAAAGATLQNASPFLSERLKTPEPATVDGAWR